MVKVFPMGEMKFSWVLPGRNPAPEGVWVRVNFLRKGRLGPQVHMLPRVVPQG